MRFFLLPAWPYAASTMGHLLILAGVSWWLAGPIELPQWSEARGWAGGDAGGRAAGGGGEEAERVMFYVPLPQDSAIPADAAKQAEERPRFAETVEISAAAPRDMVDAPLEENRMRAETLPVTVVQPEVESGPAAMIDVSALKMAMREPAAEVLQPRAEAKNEPETVEEPEPAEAAARRPAEERSEGPEAAREPAAKSEESAATAQRAREPGVGSRPGPPGGGGGGGGQADNLPLQLYGNPAPPYPPEAYAARIEGVVLVRVRIAVDGYVERADLERSSGSALLDDAALRTVRRWRFQPVKRAGIPIPFEVLKPFGFNIRSR